MEQGYKNVGIVGAGASGCLCAYFLLKNGYDVTLFDYSSPLRTLLPTGGGRCNLAHAIFDFKDLAQNYPRGEKFLYSIFSKFSTSDTIALFQSIGIDTYIQDDGRIFPTSNSSKDVRNKILASISGVNFKTESVKEVLPVENGFKIKTSKADYLFTNVILSIGGGKLITGINHNIIPFHPSLVGLNSDINALKGVVLKDVYSKDINETGDILFTHYGVSGPLIYKISSIKARDTFPYKLNFDLCPKLGDFQEILNNNSQKMLKNILSKIFPHSFSQWLTGVYSDKKGCDIDGKTRDRLIERIHNFETEIFSANNGEETVTSGGYDLNEINASTMESKIHKGLYFTGECLDIDGFCGGFNLQNAWSTAYVAAYSIINKKDWK